MAHTIIFSPLTSDYLRANRLTARWVSNNPGRLTGFACVHPVLDRGRVGAMLAEAVRTGLKAIKVHNHDGPVTREVATAARALGLPVLFDIEGRPSSIELLAREYPSVPWIIPHLGSFSDDWWAQRCVIDALERHANVYADTSGVRRFNLLSEAVVCGRKRLSLVLTVLSNIRALS